MLNDSCRESALYSYMAKDCSCEQALMQHFVIDVCVNELLWKVIMSSKRKGMFHVKHFCSVRETLLNECIKTVLSSGTECPLNRVVVLRWKRWMLLMWFAVGGDFVCGIFSWLGLWKWNWENVSRETLKEGDWGEKMMVWIRFTSEFPWMTWRGESYWEKGWREMDERNAIEM